MASPASFILPEDAAPKIKALYDYWQSIRPNDLALPGRRHFDPLDIPELLPNIWMLDVKRDPLRFRFRLIGTEIVRFTGRDSTGQWLDEVYPGYAESDAFRRSEEHTSELQSLMRISYAVFCLKKKKTDN